MKRILTLGLIVGTLLLGLFSNPTISKAADPTVYVTNSYGNSVSVVDGVTHRVKTTINVGKHPWGVSTSSDGKNVYVTNGDDNTVSVIDTRTNTVTATLPIGGGLLKTVTHNGKKVYVPSVNVAFSPDGTKAYKVDSVKTFSIIDVANDRVDIEKEVGNYPSSIAITPDGKKAYITNQNDDTVSIIDLTTPALVMNTVPVGKLPDGIAFSPDGRKAYVTLYGQNNLTEKYSISVIDTTTETVTTRINLGGDSSTSPIGVVFSSDGTKAYVADYYHSFNGSLFVINATTDTMITKVGTGNGSIGVTFTNVPSPPPPPPPPPEDPDPPICKKKPWLPICGGGR